MSDRPLCDLKDEDRDVSGCFSIRQMVTLKDNCELPVLSKPICFVLYTGGNVEETEHQEQHEAPPALKADSQVVAQPSTAETGLTAPEGAQALPLPTAAPVSAPAELADAPAQIQEFATTAAKDIAPLLEKPTDFNGVMVALIAVGGGGAAWKFYSQFSKNKHEENMEKLRLESEKSKNDSHQQCNAKHTALSAKVEELSAKLAAAERNLEEANSKSNGLELDFDVDDMKTRLEKLEKALKTKAKKKTES